MSKKRWRNSWMRLATKFCFFAVIAICSLTPVFAQSQRGGHAAGHAAGQIGAHTSGHPGSHTGPHDSGHHYQGGYGLGGISIGIGGYPGFGVNSVFGSMGYPYGYGGSRLGYSMGYSGLGYPNYGLVRPYAYRPPSYALGYIGPLYVLPYPAPYVAPYLASRPSAVFLPGVLSQPSNSNVYTGPVSADGQPTGELRPGMVLPDGAVVVSVGSEPESK